MAHLWVEETVGDWAVVPLHSPRVDLDALSRTARDRQRNAAPVPAAPSLSGAALLNTGSPGHGAWHLVAPPHVELWINGMPMLAGLHVMADRDEIRFDARDTFFFSTEALARVSPMPITDKAVMCPRCRQRIEPHTLAVCCPPCGLWHHQSDELPCWTYAPTCALCPQPTPLDAGFRWTPTEL